MNCPLPHASSTAAADGHERTALCTVLSDDFVPGFAVLVHSLKQRHPGLDLPFIIIHNDKLATLSAESRALVSRLCPQARFHEADDSRYEVVWSNRDEHLKTPERLKSAFFILEAFSFAEFDRVVTLDSDMICTGDLSPLLTHTASFAATRGFNYKTGEPHDYFNSGVMVIGRHHLAGETYRALLAHRISADYNPRRGKADQAILNDYFPAHEVASLDEVFNTTKRKYPDTAFDTIDDLLAGNVHILHFVGEKPWQLHATPEESVYTKLEAYWSGLLKEVFTMDDLLRHLRLQQHKLGVARSGADLLVHAGAMDRFVTALLDELDGAAQTRSGWGDRLLGFFRRASGPARKRARVIAKARKKWSRHHARLERKLSLITGAP